MKIDVTQNLAALDGSLITDGTEENKPVLLKTVLVNALMASLEDDKNQTGEDKLKNWTLSKDIHDGTELDLTPEQLSKLKERVGKVYTTAVVGPVFNILNGSE